MYESFDHVMTDNRTYVVLMLAMWQFVSMDMVLARWDDWKAIRREKASSQGQIEGGYNFTMEALESRESFKQDKKMPGSVVERGSLKDKDGQMTPVDEIRRS